MNKIVTLIGLLLIMSPPHFCYGQSDISESALIDGYTNKKIGGTYGDRFLIYGNLRQIIQVRHLQKSSILSESFHLFNDTTTFDKQGHITHGDLGLDIKDPLGYRYVYFDRYSQYPKKMVVDIDTTGLILITKINKDGEVESVECELKDGMRFSLTSFKHDNKFRLSEFTFYKSPNVIGLKEQYKYNSKDLLVEIDNYLGDDQLKERVLFSYLSFDKMGNWIKSIETRKNERDLVTGIVVVERKIVYY